MAEYNIPMNDAGAKYRILAGGNTSYIQSVGRYVFMTGEIYVTDADKAEKLKDIGKEREYIMIYDKKNRVIRRWVKKNFPEQAGRDVIVTGQDREDISGREQIIDD